MLAPRIAAFGLPGSTHEPVSVAEAAWSPLLSSLTLERLTGLALAAFEAGWLSLPGGQAEQELREAQLNAMLWSLMLERRLLAVVDVLEEAGVEAVVLKGAALAHTVYPDSSWRPFGDLDLLVRTRDWDRITRLLVELGMRRRLPEPRPGFDKRFGKAAVFIGGDGAEVDLHRTLTAGPFGLWIDTDELIDRAVPFEVGGRRLRRLDDTALLLHASIHASLGWRPPLLWTLRDVAQTARSDQVVWDDLLRLAKRWRMQAVLAHSLRTVRATLGVELPLNSGMFEAVRPPRRERRLVEAYTTDRRSRGGAVLATIRALPGLRSRAAFLWAMMFPSREFMAARTGSSRPSYVRRWLVPTTWVIRRGHRKVGRR